MSVLVTRDNILSIHDEVWKKVVANDFFLESFYETIETRGTPTTKKEIVKFWNEFWLSLPDNKSIHREPFYDICDIAENIFDLDEFEE